MLSLYRRLNQIRRGSPALRWGVYDPVYDGPPDCVIFRRYLPDQSETGGGMLIAVNFGSQTQNFSLAPPRRTGILVCSTDVDADHGMTPWRSQDVTLGPHEAILVQLDAEETRVPHRGS